jgi:hypothetical protein
MNAIPQKVLEETVIRAVLEFYKPYLEMRREDSRRQAKRNNQAFHVSCARG